jgi:cobalt-zinc-cadmium efflux system outer membrane protein
MRRTASVLLSGALTLGCVSSSIGSDMSRVRDLSRAQELPPVVDSRVEPAAADAVRRLLSAPLDVERAVRVAVLNNRELRARLREVGVARGQLIQAGLLPNPRAEAELLPERNTQIELRLEYDLTQAVLAPMRGRAAEPELEAARYRAAAAVVELGYRVRVAFRRAQAALQRLALGHQLLDAAAAAHEAAQALFDAGNVQELSLATSDVAYQKARVLVAQLELDVATERERLARLLGTHAADPAWQVQATLEQAGEAAALPAGLETRALRASLELIETRHRLEGLARQSGVTRTAGWLPDIAVDVHMLEGDPGDEPPGEEDEGPRFGAGVSLTIPLFDRRQGDLVALEARFDALLERYYGTSIDVRSAAREAASRVTSFHARARQYESVIVPAQKRVTQQTLLQYNAMQIGVFELLAARRDEVDVELAYVDTLRDYWSAVAGLDALLAGVRVASDGGNGSQGALEAAAESRAGEH